MDLMFAFCSASVKRLPVDVTAVSNFASRTQSLARKGGTIAELACDRGRCGGLPDGGPSEGLMDGGHMQIAAVASDRLDPVGSRQSRLADQT
jgi:hypothetical protein